MESPTQNQQPQPGQNKLLSYFKNNKNALLTFSLTALVILIAVFVVQQNKLKSLKNDLNSTSYSLKYERADNRDRETKNMDLQKKVDKIKWLSEYIDPNKSNHFGFSLNTNSNNEWDIYTDDLFNIEIKIPEATSIRKEFEEYNNLVIFTTSNFYLKLDMSIPNYDISEDNGTFPGFFDQPVTSTTTINGKDFGVFKNARGYCDGPGCSPAYINYTVANNNRYYFLTFYGDDEMDATEMAILNSLKFGETKEIK